MASRRWLGWGAALAACALLAVVAGCDRGGGDVGASPFRNLGKRADSAVPASAARPAR